MFSTCLLQQTRCHLPRPRAKQGCWLSFTGEQQLRRTERESRRARQRKKQDERTFYRTNQLTAGSAACKVGEHTNKAPLTNIKPPNTHRSQRIPVHTRNTHVRALARTRTHTHTHTHTYSRRKHIHKQYAKRKESTSSASFAQRHSRQQQLVMVRKGAKQTKQTKQEGQASMHAVYARKLRITASFGHRERIVIN